ncbi:MAG: DNA polymerase III subunit alpha [Spirochaetes bacterium]|nr:DNA polymerase III subunit alpha [Spirochaetota bacterium]
MEHKPFVHLHVHSHYSLLDGAIKINDLIQRANELKFPCIALTDHGNMFGAIEFYQTAMAHGIKPIIGIEFYLAPESRTKKEKIPGKSSHHLILLAKDSEGYRNLTRLSSAGYVEGFYYVPRIDKQILKEHTKGLIALSSCIQGEIAKNILEGNEINARRVAYEMKELFGEDYYLEIQNHNLPDEIKAIKGVLKLSQDLSIPLVATNDVHYLTADDYESHDILLCIQTQKQVGDVDRMRMKTNEFYLKSYEEMGSLFQDIPQSLTNTVEVMEKCNLRLDFGKHRIPKFQTPGGITSHEYLENLARTGLKKRCPDDCEQKWDNLQYELNVVKNMDLADYFLIVQDFINFARGRGIMVGPGRGSAAGSLLAFALGITDIDPLRNGLFFERFLNPERVSMPDIDVDFEDTRRDEIIEYVKQKYGDDRVAQIITFGTFKAKAVLKGVARALGINFNEANAITKLIQDETLQKAWENSKDLRKVIQGNEKYQQLWKNSLKLEGIISNAGTHAAGVVISNEPLINYTPFYYQSKTKSIVTQFDMDTLKEIGLLKVDLLGLKTMTIIKETLSQIKENEGLDIDIDALPLDDKKTYKLLQQGTTWGVFQVEKPGMRNLLREAKPSKFSDIAVLIALYRPGPLRSKMDEMFVRRKNGFETVQYIHPSLKTVLEETQGVIVYQEQVMKISQIIGGFSLGQADIIRRAMSSKDPEKMEEQKERFLQGAKDNKFPLKLAERIFHDIEQFAEYGFNKSHSVAYAVITYRTAFLKANYPYEFMAASLTSEIGKKVEDILKYIREAKKLKLKILPPDINTSEVVFKAKKTQQGKGIIFGLAAIKNVGTKVSECIVEERKENGTYTDIMHFFLRLDSGILNKKVMESLIKAGAFDCFQIPRKYLMNNFESMMKETCRIKQERARGQMNLFSGREENIYPVQTSFDAIDKNDEWDIVEKLKNEREVIGYYWSAHPLDPYKKVVKRITNINLEEIEKYPEGYKCCLVGVVAMVQERVLDKKENRRIAYIDVEDMNGNIDINVMPDLYQRAQDLIKGDRPIIIKGALKKEGEELYKIDAREIWPIEHHKDIKPRFVHIKIPYSFAGDEEKLKKVREILSHNRGKTTVFLHFVNGKDKVTMKIPDMLYVNPSEKFIQEITSLIGEETVYFS